MLAATKAAVPVLQFQPWLPCETKTLLMADSIKSVLELRSSIQIKQKTHDKGASIMSRS